MPRGGAKGVKLQDMRDPDVVWRETVRMRLVYATMIFGSWRWATIPELCVNHAFPEPEMFGPINPQDTIATRRLASLRR